MAPTATEGRHVVTWSGVWHPPAPMNRPRVLDALSDVVQCVPYLGVAEVLAYECAVLLALQPSGPAIDWAMGAMGGGVRLRSIAHRNSASL